MSHCHTQEAHQAHHPSLWVHLRSETQSPVSPQVHCPGPGRLGRGCLGCLAGTRRGRNLETGTSQGQILSTITQPYNVSKDYA